MLENFIIVYMISILSILIFIVVGKHVERTIIVPKIKEFIRNHVHTPEGKFYNPIIASGFLLVYLLITPLIILYVLKEFIFIFNWINIYIVGLILFDILFVIMVFKYNKEYNFDEC